jgi:hypothetical protein
MKYLLIIIALFEATTGIGLIVIPSTVVSILIGVSLNEPAAILLAHLTGVALITVGIACWLARELDQSARIMVKSMFIYNLSAALFLWYGKMSVHFTGLIVPAILLHGVLALWCMFSLQRKK